MTWRVFEEGPGERDGDDVLLDFIRTHCDVHVLDDDDRFAIMTWLAGRPTHDDVVILRVKRWAFDHAADPALRDVPRPTHDYVMHRLADLAIKTMPEAAES